MSSSFTSAGGAGGCISSSPAHLTEPQPMEGLPTTNRIDLTVDSDEDEVSEIPRADFIYFADIVKQEPEELAGISGEISELPQEGERDAEGEFVESIEKEGTSTPSLAQVALREIQGVISEEITILENVDQVATATGDGDLGDIQTAFIPPRPIATRPLSRAEVIARDEALEQQLREGIREFHASLNVNVLALHPTLASIEETPTLNDVISDGEDMSWMLEVGADAEADDAEAAAEFANVKKTYEMKKDRREATTIDDIEYAKAEAAEHRRLKRMRKIEASLQQKQADVVGDEDDELFFRELPCATAPSGRRSAPDDEEIEVPPPKKTKITKKNKLTAQELRESMAAGLEAGLAKEKKKSGRKPRKPTEKAAKKKSSPKSSAAKKCDGADKVTKKRGRPRKGPSLSNLASLTQSNVIRDAQANEFKRDMPTFTSKDKSKALQELIKSIPTEERRIVSSDKAAILEASKKFNGRGAVKSDQKGGWLLRGMKSSLYGHQLLGAAFLRDRENGNTHPLGGMVCDEMGFGKTIMMLANIARPPYTLQPCTWLTVYPQVDGKSDPDNPVKTTLIVATPSLVTQWADEIEKHVAPKTLGRILRWHSGSKINSNDVLEDLKGYDIILTTYGEVRKSYPVYKPPMHLVTEQAKNDWWANFYKEKVGELHRMKFRRVVLDEAQAIKNHESKTSVAVRQLKSHFKWCISGTPIQNYIEEFYPYFNFLKVPHTGDYTTFVNNYCESRTDRSLVNMDRLTKMLQMVMLRRTHVDTLFNSPVVKLPGIAHDTVMVEFNEVERAIYKIVKSKFINVINTYSKSGDIETHYHHILAMMLKLRMLTGHALLIQDTLKELLVAADVEALWRLTAKEVETSGDKPNTNALLQLKKMLTEKTKARRDRADHDSSQETATNVEGNDDDVGGAFGLTFKFRKFLRSLKDSKVWPELHSRSICSKCRSIPDDPHVTSCFHVFCKECLTAMAYESAQLGEPRVSCLECGTYYDEASPCRGLEELGFNSPTTLAKVAKNRSRKNTKAAKKKGRKASEGIEDSEDEEDVDWIDDVEGALLPSAKTTATKALILNWFKKEPNTKIIIYTQFLDMIRILQKMCAIEKWGYVTFTGKMTFDARDKSIATFRDDLGTNIMLCSLKAGGVGLNLTMASKVIILDLWFNSSVESQAYCRAFRIGQEKKVEVVRFVVKGSIDEDLINMQERKDIEIHGAMGPDAHRKRATITELLSLFGEVREEGSSEFILVQDEPLDEDSDVDMGEIVPPRPF